MKGKQGLIILALCIAFVLALYFLSLEKQTTPEWAQKRVDAYFAISKLLAADEVDFPRVEALYENELMKFVVDVEGEEDLYLNVGIEEAFEAGGKGRIPKINAELAQGFLNQAFFHLMEKEVENFADSAFDPKQTVEVLKVVYETQKATVLLADRFLGKAQMVPQIRGLLNNMTQAAASAEDLTNLADQLIWDIKTAHILVVFSLLEEIEKAKTQDKLVALALMARAKKHYEFFFADHAITDRKSSVMVNGEWIKEPKKMKTEMIWNDLERCFKERIPKLPHPFPKPEAEKVEQTEEGANE